MKFINSVCVFSSISLLFLANFVSSENAEYTLTANYDIPEHKVVIFEIKGSLTLTCNLTAAETSEVHVIWLKDDKKIEDIPELSKKVTITTDENKIVNQLKITKAQAEDAGNYTCRLEDLEDRELTEAQIRVFTKPAVKLIPNTSVVEGEKLTIHCQIISKPEPIITWRIGNETYDASAERIKIKDDEENGYRNAILVIENVELTDRNEYSCMARTNFSLSNDAESTTYVRVKDKFAALWPFLGIVAEVVVLCAIILIYEKKRNRTELDESDTDQSPDQKNTPDNGKSDVRHRK